MLQIVLTLAIFVILVIPMGKYMYHIATNQKTFADKVFNPIDNFIYKICRIKGDDMGWKKYALTLLMAPCYDERSDGAGRICDFEIPGILNGKPERD